MTYFESLQADIPLHEMNPPALDAFEDTLWAYYNSARDEFRLDAAREDLRTYYRTIGEIATGGQV